MDSHLVAVKRILRYIKSTSAHGLFLSPTSTTLLHGFTDSDWGGDMDDRKSTTGFAIYLGNHLISLSSRKQCVVSRSSTEAEYRALAAATSELTWVEFLLREIGCFSSSTPILLCDNLSATYLIANPIFHSRTKHMEIDFHFVRDKVCAKTLVVRYVNTHDQIADLLTKPLSKSRFHELKFKLTVVQHPAQLEGE